MFGIVVVKFWVKFSLSKKFKYFYKVFVDFCCYSFFLVLWVLIVLDLV